jgi:hypothetical protein
MSCTWNSLSASKLRLLSQAVLGLRAISRLLCSGGFAWGPVPERPSPWKGLYVPPFAPGGLWHLFQQAAQAHNRPVP